ncbi:hypothetical protein VNO77_01086 [Canavalia gladiata]|uniref:Protein kinase domain-containing protein n=1 Tax=Canavalia gladiata TaxID=3824 RepID=A0AAN9MV97_CANGL
MGHNLSKSPGKNKETFAAENEFSEREEELNLIGTRDFISLLLTYPVKLAEEEKGILKACINAFSERKPPAIRETWAYNRSEHPWRVPAEKAMICVEGLLPMEIVEFLDVLWIDASTFLSNFRVQEEINKMMVGTVIEDNDMLRTRRAGEEMANRYLVILVDRDSDKKLDPRKVHFPAGIVVLITTEPSAQVEKGDEHTITCKIIDLNIRTQDHLLPWEIFCSCVSSSMVRSSRVIQRIAVQIVEICRGHLLAIALVAKSLKNVKDVKQWELALDKLNYTNPSYNYRESDQIGISRVMVNAFVNIIWESINKTLKLCLELSLFVHKIKNGVPGEALMSNWVSTELAHTQETSQHLFTFDSSDIESEYTTEEAEHNIRELLDRSVLLQCESSNVRLPIETYDIIESLHTLNPSILRYGALGLTEPLHIGRWHGLIRIELMDNKICELPDSPECPKLKVLLLQGNVDLMDIPDLFFDHMPLLRYLNLSYTSIRELPPSIFKLIQLKKFYLKGCDLFMDLPPKIGQLKNLEELDLDGTSITHLPEEIRELINLQNLTLCFDGYQHEHSHGKNGKQISNLTIIPPRVISNLTRLNCLSINVDPEDKRWNENVLNILLEIFGLERLEMVNIYIPKAEFLELIPAYKPIDLRLVVGHHAQRFIVRATAKVEEKFKHCDHRLKFVNGVNVPNGMKKNLGSCRALYLDRHMTIKSLSEFELKNLDRLKVCILGECNEMETVVDVSYSLDGHALPNLEFLSVFYMKNLRSICKEIPRMSPVFLHSLKTITLHTCPMLTTIFTSSFIDNLSLLEELIVEDCSKLTTLVNLDSIEHETKYFLPRLKMISLLYLPELVSIFNGLPVGLGLEKMGFYCCPKLRSLSKAELSSKSLWVIKGEKKWWEALKWNEAEWEDADMLEFLDQFFSTIDEEADILTQLVADPIHLLCFTDSWCAAQSVKVSFSPPPIPLFIDVVVAVLFFKGPPPLTVAVKLLKYGHNSFQGNREWLAEVNLLGQLSHPNLVKLIGYCCKDKHRVLIYEYMSRGSVEHQLFSKSLCCLPWYIRMKIAFGVAKGLAFLHEASFSYINWLCASNILLDQDYNAKLSDFGRLQGQDGDKSHAEFRLIGRFHYAAPEYLSTGRLTPKSDVYSFGVVLLELLTGRKSSDRVWPAGVQSLSECVLPLLKKRKFLKIIDPRLDGDYPVKEVHKAAMLACKCLHSDPKARPLMRDVVDSLEPLQAHNDSEADLKRKAVK